MKILLFNTGIYDVNTYLVYDEASKEAAVIDLGGVCSKLFDAIRENNLKIKYLLNTHGHFDHLSGELDFQTKYPDVPVYLHKEDEELAENLEIILNYMGAAPQKPPKITNFLDENTQLKLGEIQIKVIETPGHTKGGVCFLANDVLFSGDTLFYESIGRTDFPGGSFEQLQNSIRQKLFKLPDATKVLPGHGDATQIGYEKLNNRCVIGA